jgi:hypothetical protein
MALVSCPECGKSVSEKARACPNCGYPIKSGGYSDLSKDGGYVGYEYKSSTTIFGMPLVHIVYGPGYGGISKPAKGFIAIGNIAIGVIAIGGFAVGVITLAGIGLGIACLGGMAIGFLFGAGGIATGYIAVGGIAIGVYAIGGLSIGTHTLHNDPQFREYFRSLLGSFHSNR